MAMWLSKFLKRSTKSGKVNSKLLERGGGGGGWFGLKLPTLRAVVSPPVVTLRKGFCLFHSVTTGGETIADRAGAACEYILQGGTFSCIW